MLKLVKESHEKRRKWNKYVEYVEYCYNKVEWSVVEYQSEMKTFGKKRLFFQVQNKWGSQNQS